MKIRISLVALAFPLFMLVPANASENEFSYDEFEINGLSEVQEEESEWEFSVGIEGVFGKAKMSGHGDVYVRDEHDWWRGGYVRKKTDFENFYGINFRLNWIKKSGDSDFVPEIYANFGLITGQTENEDIDEQIVFLSCDAGMNMHALLSDSVSVFGGIRLGAGNLVRHSDLTPNIGATYGVGGGILVHLGKRGNSIRLGVDYLANSAEIDDEDFCVSNPKWTLFSLSYNASF